MPASKGQHKPNWALVTSNMALAQDARTGGYLYVADLLVMHAFSSFPSDSPKVALFTTIVFLLVALAREVILRQMKKNNFNPWTLTKWFMFASTLGTATMAFRSLAVFELYGMTNINSYICFLGLTTFATGMITSFRSNKYILYSQILITVAPGALFLLLTPSDSFRVFAVILFFFSAFILYQGALSSRNWTELERAKTTLEDERNQLKTFVDEIPGSAAWLSASMKIYGANQSFLDMMASHRDNLPLEMETKVKAFLESSEEAISTTVKTQVDDALRTFSLQLKRYIYKKETCIFVIMMDIEDQIILTENLEAQRAKNAQASRLSSLGEMAGGIAHEINNPLAIIHGRTKQIESILQRKSDAHAPSDFASLQLELLEKTKSITKTVDRITKIIKGLKSFARDGSVDQMETTAAKDIIDDTLVFCNEKFKNHGVELDVDLLNVDLNISCQPQQISQVLLNLLNNAFDAQEKKEVKKISIKVVSTNDYVKFSVSDYGEGIKFPEKLFQAFFTTKPVGQGTGIGLSISYGIVKRHFGNMYLESSQNPTTISFEIPLVRKAA